MANINSKTFGYCRVSSTDQKEDRQLEAMLELGINERDIFVDKCSGKNFDRPQYQALKVQLREGDILVIKSIDRLGRNYKQICEEWREITREIKANIKVLDMPVLDTTKTEGLIGEIISDIVLQLLSYVAEGVPTKVIQKLLRHGRASITEDIYIDIDNTSDFVKQELNRVFAT